MARQNPSTRSENGLVSLTESIVTDPAESTTHQDSLQEQLKSSERLTEYYNQVVAELRASLERIEQGDQAS